MTDGAFLGSWYHFPPLEGFEYQELLARRWDAVYISHFHADHYGGLQKSFDYGPIYCSEVTGNLVEQQLRVDSRYIVRLPMDQPVVLDANVMVELLDANQ
jgi:Cft2 family RNA processing exonuclease